MGTFRSGAFALLSLSLLVGSSQAEDPLPPIQLKSEVVGSDVSQASSMADFPTTPLIAMAAVPLRDLTTTPAIETSDPSALRTILQDAASSNDRPRFDAALARAQVVVETLPLGDARNSLRRAISIYSDLQKVWGYAATDKYGAFFDDEALPGLFDRLDSNYADYGRYIAQFTVTDQLGRVFYPTTETRTFLQQQAGNSGIQLAAHRSRTVQHAETHPTATVSATRSAAAKPARGGTHHRVRQAKAAVAPSSVINSAVKVVPQPTVTPQAGTPQAVTPALTTQQTGPQVAAGAPLRTDALNGDGRRAANLPQVRPVAAHTQPNVLSNPNQTQGLLFIIIALISIGVMTLWARTPQSSSTTSSASTQPSQIFPPVEPFANGEAPAPKKSEADVVRIKQNRAS